MMFQGLSLAELRKIRSALPADLRRDLAQYAKAGPGGPLVTKDVLQKQYAAYRKAVDAAITNRLTAEGRTMPKKSPKKHAKKTHHKSAPKRHAAPKHAAHAKLDKLRSGLDSAYADAQALTRELAAARHQLPRAHAPRVHKPKAAKRRHGKRPSVTSLLKE